MNKKWWQSKKLWICVVGQIAVIAGVVIPLVSGMDKEVAATLSTSLGVLLEAVVLAMLGAHAYTDAKVTGASLIADALSSDPTKPGHA